jgi:hypothetical protein
MHRTQGDHRQGKTEEKHTIILHFAYYYVLGVSVKRRAVAYVYSSSTVSTRVSPLLGVDYRVHHMA